MNTENTAQEPRFVVDGHEFPNGESNLAGDGKYPPFYVFDVVRQEHLPLSYPTRSDAKMAAAAVAIAAHCARLRPPTYYSEPFTPHPWVIDAVMAGLAGGYVKDEAVIQRLTAERDEADRRAGAAERANASLRDDAMARQSWLYKAKQQAGYSDRVSFDDVWKETLEKARKYDALEAK